MKAPWKLPPSSRASRRRVRARASSRAVSWSATSTKSSTPGSVTRNRPGYVIGPNESARIGNKSIFQLQYSSLCTKLRSGRASLLPRGAFMHENGGFRRPVHPPRQLPRFQPPIRAPLHPDWGVRASAESPRSGWAGFSLVVTRANRPTGGAGVAADQGFSPGSPNQDTLHCPLLCSLPSIAPTGHHRNERFQERS